MSKDLIPLRFGWFSKSFSLIRRRCCFCFCFVLFLNTAQMAVCYIPNVVPLKETEIATLGGAVMVYLFRQRLMILYIDVLANNL